MDAKASLSCRVLASALVALVLVCIAPGAVSAQSGAASDVFVIAGVPVDETAESVAAAREAAIANGRVVAAQRLFARLTRQVDQAGLAEIDPQTANFLVDSLQIDNERTSDVRYLADLTVRFRPDAVRQYLRGAGIPFAEARSRPVLIVPVILDGARYVLWEEPNPWRDAWLDHPPSTGLVPVITPLGDLSDIAQLSADLAVDADVGALGAMAQRYGAGSSIVAVASLTGEPDAPAQIDVTALRVGRVDEAPIVFSVVRLADEEADAFMQRAAAAVVSSLDEEWKVVSTIRFGEPNRVHAAVPVSGLANWIEIRKRLGEVPAVSDVRLLALSAETVEIEVDFFGDLESFRIGLERFDFLFEDTGLSGEAANAVAIPAVPTHVIRLPGV